MHYELFLKSDLSCKSLAEIIQSIIVESMNEEITVHISEEEIVIGIKFFSLALEIEDISDIAFIRRHYDIDVNVSIRVQLFGNTFYQGIEVLFKVIGNLMRQVGGNLLFLENGSDQLLRKENGQLIINSDLDQYQLKYITKGLLSFLEHSYIKEKLPN
ncbi:hypothetical protein MKX96_12340 [Psychrobacillus sp. FSL W7-1493]|uniref:hypothetical protein n=1 Tax=Psychrobacillus sp. FSL W7-1493 TaxID=2921552 RepID=UPI0030FBAF38